MMRDSDSILVNKEHSRQDINSKRLFDLSRNRYAFAKELLPVSESNLVLLDVGGGAGEFTSIARNKGYKTFLADGNSLSIENEINRGFDASIIDLNMGLPGIPNQKFDAVVCLDVIEHIVPAEQLIQEIFRVLKPGGFLIISTPNFGYLIDRFHYMLGYDVKEEGYHYRFFTRIKLTHLLEKAGFTIESTNSIGSALGINLMLRLLTLGKLRLPHFSVHPMFESWLASTFVYRCRRTDSDTVK